jgi:hypothetical protein
MTDSLPGVLAPYERFLEFQNRRRRVAAEFAERDLARTIDTGTAGTAAAAAPAPAADGTSPDPRRTP